MTDLAAEASFHERVASLGSPVGAPLEISPLPWRYALGGPFLVVLGLGALVPAYFLQESDPVVAAGFVVAGLLLLGGGGWMLVRRAQQRGRLELFDRGLSLSRGASRAMAVYAEVDDVRLVETEQLSNGNFGGWNRRLVLSGRGGKTTIRHFAPAGAVDELGPRVAVVLDALAKAADLKRKTGEPLRGDGWTLEGDQLRVGAVSVPMAELKSVAVFDGRVSLWKGLEDDPFFGVKVGSRNARLLQLVVAKGLGPAGESAGVLGRVLFRRPVPKAISVVLGLMGVPGAIGGVLILLTPGDDGLALGAGTLAVSLLLCFGVAWTWASVFEARERGVERKTLFSRKMLRYEEIERFSFAATRQYHNGAYTGTALVLSFVSREGLKIGLTTTTYKSSDQDLDYLRDVVTQGLALRFSKQIEGGGELRWGPDARLGKGTITFHQKKLFGTGPERTLALTTPFHAAFADGRFRLTVAGEGGVALEIPCASENFYPGYVLFQQLVAAAHSTGARAG